MPSLVTFLFLEKNFTLSLDELVFVFSLFIFRIPLWIRASSILSPFFIDLEMVLGLFILSSYIKSGTKLSMHKLTCCSSGMFSENLLIKFLQRNKNVINGSHVFYLVEQKLESVTSFVMLKEKWEMNFSTTSDQDLMLVGSLEYHSSAGPPRERGKSLMR